MLIVCIYHYGVYVFAVAVFCRDGTINERVMMAALLL